MSGSSVDVDVAAAGGVWLLSRGWMWWSGATFDSCKNGRTRVRRLEDCVDALMAGDFQQPVNSGATTISIHDPPQLRQCPAIVEKKDKKVGDKGEDYRLKRREGHACYSYSQSGYDIW